MSDLPNTFALEAPTKFYICVFTAQKQLFESIARLLAQERYEFEYLSSIDALVDFAIHRQEQIDCLILHVEPQETGVLERLRQTEILLPTAILNTTREDILPALNLAVPTQVNLYSNQLDEIKFYIDLAIGKFVSFVSETKLDTKALTTAKAKIDLASQQKRLSNKLQNKGKSAIGNRRDGCCFYRNLGEQERSDFDLRLQQSYRAILLEYFDDSSQTNKLIDEFVDLAFYADISTSHIIEIHMELIDNFAQQLKLEGRSEDILLDYRLPLIDAIAHLCELYRRTIPQKISAPNCCLQ